MYLEVFHLLLNLLWRKNCKRFCNRCSKFKRHSWISFFYQRSHPCFINKAHVAAKPSFYKPCSWAPTLKLTNIYFRKRTLYFITNRENQSTDTTEFKHHARFFSPSSNAHTQWLWTKLIHYLFFDIAAPILSTAWRLARQSSSTA
jgi:hypothetical protein